MARITINEGLINRLVNNAFAATMGEFAKANDRAIAEPLYSWPRQTVRQSGEIAGSPRNIVDTGELLRSRSVQVRGDDATFGWSADHALIAHEGATLRNGTVLPPRRWTREALKLYPLDRNYANELGRLL